MVAFFGGYASQSHLLGRPSWKGCGTDRRYANQLLDSLSSANERHQLERRAIRRSEELVDESWTQIQALANELLGRQRMSGGSVKKFLKPLL
jgi:hypothetical protein